MTRMRNVANLSLDRPAAHRFLGTTGRSIQPADGVLRRSRRPARFGERSESPKAQVKRANAWLGRCRSRPRVAYPAEGRRGSGAHCRDAGEPTQPSSQPPAPLASTLVTPTSGCVQERRIPRKEVAFQDRVPRRSVSALEEAAEVDARGFDPHFRLSREARSRRDCIPTGWRAGIDHLRSVSTARLRNGRELSTARGRSSIAFGFGRPGSMVKPLDGNACSETETDWYFAGTD